MGTNGNKEGPVVNQATLISECHFSRRTEKALASIPTLGELSQMSEQDLYQIRGLGVACVDEIKEKLSECGLSLRVDVFQEISHPTANPCCSVCLNRVGDECHVNGPQVHFRLYGDRIEHKGWWPVVSEDSWCGQCKLKDSKS